MNGARISEAKQILLTWLEENKESFDIIAEKTQVPRPVKIPKMLLQYKPLYNIYKEFLDKATKHKLADYCKRNYGINTHSLRYAFIRYLVEKGTDPFVISLILGHKKIDQTLAYARKVNANQVFNILDS
jgi:site-specific recombinase XerD